MIVTSNKTYNSSRLEILQRYQQPFTVAPNSTLNEALSIGESQPPGVGYPVSDYIVIGAGGAEVGMSAENIGFTEERIHGPTDATLFSHLPFIMRPVNEDLSSIEKAKYRLRKHITGDMTADNNEYFAYYARKADSVYTSPETRVVTLEDGKIISDTPYVPNATNLTPSPVDISNTVANTNTGRLLITESLRTIAFTKTEIEEIREAAFILYGDYKYASLTEVGLVAGFSESIESTIGGVTATYEELRAAQVMNFVNTPWFLKESTNDFSFTVSAADTLPYPPTAG